MSFRTMQCPSCQKQIQVPNDVDTAICMYCGKNIICNTANDYSQSTNIDNLLGLARAADAGSNLQEAEKYYTKVLEIDPTISEAWMGKGNAAGWQSSLARIRFDEMVIAFKNAIATAPDNEKETVLTQCIGYANALVITMYKLSVEHLNEYSWLQDSWDSHIEMTMKAISLLEELHSWDNQNQAVLENIIELCKDNIDGFKFKDKLDNNTSKVWIVTPEHESFLRSNMNLAIQKIQKIDPNYTPPIAQQQKPDACFVVTATMGNPQHPLVLLMREFRDTRLVKSKNGRKFISWYYKNGPKLASIISKSLILRIVSFLFIVVPASWLVRVTQKKK